jgi:mono/diheme cytochrome c family protein
MITQNGERKQMVTEKETTMKSKYLTLSLGLAAGLAASAALASGDAGDAQVSDRMSRSGFVLENGLAVPAFDPVRGRELFATKGCVVCHSINGLGGEDAPEFAAEWMEPPMNAFDFAANMWRGAGAMIMMQEDELDGQIELDGAELAAIIAFVHDADEQKKFTLSDVPHDMRHFMRPDFEEETDHEIMQIQAEDWTVEEHD